MINLLTGAFVLYVFINGKVQDMQGLFSPGTIKIQHQPVLLAVSK